MIRRFVAVAAACCSLLAIGLPAAFGDANYHSTQIAFHAVAGAPLRSGFVENIHTDGPRYFVHERYVLNGSMPSVSLQASARLFATGDCSGPFLPVQTAVVETNGEGNGETGFDFPPSAIPLQNHDRTFWAIWYVGDAGDPTYATDCSRVTTD